MPYFSLIFPKAVVASGSVSSFPSTQMGTDFGYFSTPQMPKEISYTALVH